MKKKLFLIISVIVLGLCMVFLTGCTQKSDEAKRDGALRCSISVSCDKILENTASVSEKKKDLIPKDGIIYFSKDVAFSEGESAFDVLKREMKENKIHLDFEEMPMYDSVYIKGIGNIYEFDCGEASGWTYLVNGESPMIASSNYKLKNSDKIEFVYSCNLMEQ